MIAKNYLTEPEMAQLSRLVNAYLDVAEDMAQRKIPMTMRNNNRIRIGLRLDQEHIGFN